MKAYDIHLTRYTNLHFYITETCNLFVRSCFHGGIRLEVSCASFYSCFLLFFGARRQRKAGLVLRIYVLPVHYEARGAGFGFQL